MFNVNLNGVSIMVYDQHNIDQYLRIAGDPRKTAADLFLKVSDSLYIRRTLTRADLYKAMGYQVFDFAFPEPWADSPAALHLFETYGDKIPYKDPETGQEKIRRWQKGDPRPSLVWCYDAKEGEDRPSIFGYPVFDRQVIRDLGRVIIEKLAAGEVEHISTDWLDKRDPDLHPLIEGEINGIS